MDDHQVPGTNPPSPQKKHGFPPISFGLEALAFSKPRILRSFLIEAGFLTPDGGASLFQAM